MAYNEKTIQPRFESYLVTTGFYLTCPGAIDDEGPNGSDSSLDLWLGGLGFTTLTAQFQIGRIDGQVISKCSKVSVADSNILQVIGGFERPFLIPVVYDSSSQCLIDTAHSHQLKNRGCV